jgi:integrase
MELLETLLGPDGKRRLRLRHMTNDELFKQYDSELLLRLHNAKDLGDHRRILSKFKGYVGGYPITVELAKGFLSQYTNRKARTLARYTKMIGGLMKWYGEPLDVKVKVPKSLPDYTEDSDIDKLTAAVENKKTHKGSIVRDLLLVDLALKTGMRRGELANLEAGDIHADFLIVRSGKGQKDRAIPLLPDIALRLQNFTKGMAPSEKVFKLKAPCIGDKIRLFSKRAGVNIHTHSLRHKFATDLLEQGANIKQVQELLGHANLSTTEVYLSLAGGSLRQAINLLGKEQNSKNHETGAKPKHKFHPLEERIVTADGRRLTVVPASTVEDVPIPPRIK